MKNIRAHLFSWLYMPADLWIRLISFLTGIKCMVMLDFRDE